MTFDELLGNISIDRGFYIRSKGFDTYYTCADDFYESPEARYIYERPVQFIDVLNGRLRVVLGD